MAANALTKYWVRSGPEQGMEGGYDYSGPYDADTALREGRKWAQHPYYRLTSEIRVVVGEHPPRFATVENLRDGVSVRIRRGELISTVEELPT